MPTQAEKSAELRRAALEYHEFPTPGKVAIAATKQLVNQRDLALAYSPGVAAACEEIVADPANAFRYTSRGNLVAVVTNGTAVLGLGDIGPLAAKPVMEGKAVLFKKFAGIDVFDLEIQEKNLDKLVDVIAALEPTFGGINLEDIKAPECFVIEEELKKRMGIPVFHDDQHGTAIISGAALLNAAIVQGKKLADLRIVFSGAGAAAISCARHYVNLGARRENIIIVDSEGVVYAGRTSGMNSYKQEFANGTAARTLAEALVSADVFAGLSKGGVLKPEMVKTMAEKPIIFAMANPDPEIGYHEAKAARPDCVMATGRSDFPNQVNNVLGFPFIFRGALDVWASTINEDMKVAATMALAELARRNEVPQFVVEAYGLKDIAFGPDYIIPKPMDPRVLVEVSMAVAQAAMDTGVARIPIADMKAYEMKLAGVAEKIRKLG